MNDAVDSDIGVAEVVPLFGLFVKYTLKSTDQLLLLAIVLVNI